jgi:hypothetical protein
VRLQPADGLGSLLERGAEAALEAALAPSKLDLCFNPRRFDSWERLALVYHDAADELLVSCWCGCGWGGGVGGSWRPVCVWVVVVVVVVCVCVGGGGGGLCVCAGGELWCGCGCVGGAGGRRARAHGIGMCG